VLRLSSAAATKYLTATQQHGNTAEQRHFIKQVLTAAPQHFFEQQHTTSAHFSIELNEIRTGGSLSF